MIKDIDIQGACTHTQLAERTAQTRLLDFPDGIGRFITLEGRYWRALDASLERHGQTFIEKVTAVMPLEISADFARDMGISLEEAITHDLKAVLGGHLWHEENERRPANKNCPEFDSRRKMAKLADTPNLRHAFLKATLPPLP